MARNYPKPLPEITPEDIVRFLGHVDVRGETECWPWKAGRFSNGYGAFVLGGRCIIASRIAFFIRHGRDPFPDLVLHSCDNPPCCNGEHLFSGTPEDNVADAVAKGRNRNGSNPPRGDQAWFHFNPTQGEDHYKAVLTEDHVREIRAALLKENVHYGFYAEFARRFGVLRSTVRSAAVRKTWRHI